MPHAVPAFRVESSKLSELSSRPGSLVGYSLGERMPSSFGFAIAATGMSVSGDAISGM